MKHIYMGLLALLTCMLALAPAAAAPADTSAADPVWGNAPDFSMTSFEGEELKLSDFAGKPIILNFWAEWCPPCVAELPLLQAAYEQYGSEVQFMTVALERGRNDPAGFMAQRELQLPGALAADEVAGQYGIGGIPATFFISSRGDVLGMKTGPFVEEELPYVLDAMLEFEDSLLVTD